jgi:Ribbon-helix-helix protein, copG family
VRQWSEEAELEEKVRTEISSELLEALRRLAEEQGRSESEVLDEAVRFFLGSYAYFTRIAVHSDVDIETLFPWGFNMRELLDRVDAWQRERGVEPLSDEEAMRLAVEEQHTSRRES